MSFHGTLYGVEDADGRFRPLPEVVLGTLPGVGLVTAPSRAALDAGRIYAPGDASAWVPIRAVFYRRRRGPPYAGLHWRHEVRGTDLGLGAGRPVFRFRGGRGVAPAAICPTPPGEFICDG